MAVIKQTSRNFSTEVNKLWTTYIETGLKKKGITKDQLAEQLGMSQSFVYGFCQGPYKRLGLFDTARVCAALDLDVKHLLTITGAISPQAQTNPREALIANLPAEDLKALEHVIDHYIAGVTGVIKRHQ